MAIDWTPVLNAAAEAVAEGRPFKRQWGTLLGLVSRKTSSPDDRRALMHLLEEAEIAATPWLTGDGPTKTTFITMVDGSHLPPPHTLRFAMEAPMEDLIAAAMPTFPGLKGVELVGQQVMIGTGRPDLLGREKLSKGRTRWFIIEVEVKNVAEAIAQVSGYANDFRKHGARAATIGTGTKVRSVKAKPDDEIVLVVIAQDGSPELAARLRLAAEHVDANSRWITMTVGAEVEVPRASA